METPNIEISVHRTQLPKRIRPVRTRMNSRFSSEFNLNRDLHPRSSQISHSNVPVQPLEPVALPHHRERRVNLVVDIQFPRIIGIRIQLWRVVNWIIFIVELNL